MYWTFFILIRIHSWLPFSLCIAVKHYRKNLLTCGVTLVHFIIYSLSLPWVPPALSSSPSVFPLVLSATMVSPLTPLLWTALFIPLYLYLTSLPHSSFGYLSSANSLLTSWVSILIMAQWCTFKRGRQMPCMFSLGFSPLVWPKPLFPYCDKRF